MTELKYVEKQNMNNNFSQWNNIKGVVYSTAAEQVIRRGFNTLHRNRKGQGEIYQPTVIGYMVDVKDTCEDCGNPMPYPKTYGSQCGPPMEDEQWGLKGGVKSSLDEADDGHIYTDIKRIT